MTYSLGRRKVGGRKSYSEDSPLLPCLSRLRLNFFRFLLSISLRHSSPHPRKWLTLDPCVNRYFSKTQSICYFSHHMRFQSSPSVYFHSRWLSALKTQLRKEVLNLTFWLGRAHSTGGLGNAPSLCICENTPTFIPFIYNMSIYHLLPHPSFTSHPSVPAFNFIYFLLCMRLMIY